MSERLIKSLRAALVLSLVTGGSIGCDRSEKYAEASAMTGGGDPDRGSETIRVRGCGTCHTIPGIRGAEALVGPPLDRIGSRTYIGGVLQNTPTNMKRWLSDPPGVDPQTAMPNLRLSEGEVRDVASYLYTLR
jgi:cytochrome c